MGYMIAALWNKVDVETTYQFNCHFNALTICSRHNLKKCNNSTTQANQHNDLVCGHEKRGTTEWVMTFRSTSDVQISAIQIFLRFAKLATQNFPLVGVSLLDSIGSLRTNATQNKQYYSYSIEKLFTTVSAICWSTYYFTVSSSPHKPV